MYNKLWKKNTTKIDENMYCSSNSILNNFSMLYGTELRSYTIHFCMNVYSSELLELSNKYRELINIAYRNWLRDVINYHKELTTLLTCYNALDDSLAIKLHRKKVYL